MIPENGSPSCSQTVRTPCVLTFQTSQYPVSMEWETFGPDSLFTSFPIIEHLDSRAIIQDLFSIVSQAWLHLNTWSSCWPGTLCSLYCVTIQTWNSHFRWNALPMSLKHFFLFVMPRQALLLHKWQICITQKRKVDMGITNFTRGAWWKPCSAPQCQRYSRETPRTSLCLRSHRC